MKGEYPVGFEGRWEGLGEESSFSRSSSTVERPKSSALSLKRSGELLTLTPVTRGYKAGSIGQPIELLNFLKQSISEFVVFVSRLYDAVLSSLSSVRARRRRSESGICGAHPRSFLALDDGFDVDPILPIARMILDESLSRSEKEKREESSFWRRKGFRFVESSESRANSTAMSDTEFRVSALLVGHSEDVKSITATSLNLYSTSYDSSIRSWTSTPAATTQESTETASASSQRWREVTKLEPHNEGFINASHAFSFTPTGSATPQEYLATGGKSALVQIYSLPLESNVNATPAFSLIGHRTNVCAIHSTPTPTSSTVNSGKRRQKLVSSSWDGTARIWDVEKDFECTAVLEGHTGAVWDVLFVKQTSKDEDTLLTGSSFFSLSSRNARHREADLGVVRQLPPTS